MTQRRRTRLIGLGLLGWLVVIVVSAGDTPADKTWLGIAGLEVAFFIVLGGASLASLILIIVSKPFSEWQPRERERHTGMWGLMLLVLALLIWRPDLLSGLVTEELLQEEAQELPGEIVEVDELITEPETKAVAELTDILLVLVGVGVGASVLLWIKRRDDNGELPPAVAPDPTQDLVRALDEATEQLRAASTPRLAVLTAYATLERSLSDHGLHRIHAETPTEHMRRVFTKLTVHTAPFLALGSLYERARFSEQEILDSHQQQAAVELDAARAALTAVVINPAAAGSQADQ